MNLLLSLNNYSLTSLRQWASWPWAVYLLGLAATALSVFFSERNHNTIKTTASTSLNLLFIAECSLEHRNRTPRTDFQFKVMLCDGKTSSHIECTYVFHWNVYGLRGFVHSSNIFLCLRQPGDSFQGPLPLQCPSWYTWILRPVRQASRWSSQWLRYVLPLLPHTERLWGLHCWRQRESTPIFNLCSETFGLCQECVCMRACMHASMCVRVCVSACTPACVCVWVCIG